MKLLLCVLCLLFSIALADQAHADRKVALVIGNSAYQYTSKLANPKNDATDVAAALKKHGFQVIDGFDLTKTDFEHKVRAFSTELRGAEAGLFFYAGHGLQVAGQNYLVPIDAKAETADALDWEMLRLDLIHRTMERAANTNIIFLDACRDNPLTRNLARAMGTRSAEIGRGLAAVESGVGTLISFSTQPGNVALDGRGRNSPFAAALVRQLSKTKDDLSAVLIAVRNDVMKETQRKQVPWEHSALTGRFYFSPLAPVAPAAPQMGEAGQAWALVKESANPAVLDAYAKQFENTFYAALARDKAAQLRNAQEAREADGARRAEEIRKAENARKALEAQKAAEARKADELRRAEEIQKAENARKALEAQRAEEARKADETRKAAETAKVASLTVEAAQPPLSGPAVTDNTALARALQKELVRVGCHPGEVDGNWGSKAKRALAEFARLAKTASLSTDEPSEQALKAVTDQKGRICPLICGANEVEMKGKCVAKAKAEPRQVEKSRPAPKASGENKGGKESMCWNTNGMYVVPCSDPRADTGRRMY